MPSSRARYASGYCVMLTTSQPCVRNHADSARVEKRGPCTTTTVPRSCSRTPVPRAAEHAHGGGGGHRVQALLAAGFFVSDEPEAADLVPFELDPLESELFDSADLAPASPPEPASFFSPECLPFAERLSVL